VDSGNLDPIPPLLCTTISIDFNSQISFPLCQGVGVGNFGKVGVGNFGEVGYFTSDSASAVYWPFWYGVHQAHKQPKIVEVHQVVDTVLRGAWMSQAPLVRLLAIFLQQILFE